MDYPVRNRFGFDQRTWTALKIIAIVLAFWLLNVLFVVVHEGGHATAATLFGVHVDNVYISPTGLEGATTHDPLQDQAQVDVVLAAGVAATTVAVVVAWLLRLEIVVYVLGLRTVESLLNYEQGSDMLCLTQNIGSNAYLLSMALIVVTGLAVGLTLRRRIGIGYRTKRAREAAELIRASPAPAA